MPQKRLPSRPARRRPDLGLRPARCDQTAAVGTEGEVAHGPFMLQGLRDLFTSSSVPNLGGMIRAGRGQIAAIAAENRIEHLLLMPKRKPEPPARSFPD